MAIAPPAPAPAPSSAHRHAVLATRQRLSAAVSGLWGVLGVLVALEVITRLGLLPTQYLPPVSVVIVALVGLLGEETTWQAIGQTLLGWAAGLGLAAAIAVPAGLIFGSSALLYRATRPVVEFLRPVPSVALIPVAILIFGTGFSSKVFLAVFACIWPLLVQTIYGVRDVDPTQLATARSYRVRRQDRVLHILVPSVIPYVATGVRIASATSLILVVSGELLIGSPGLGREISAQQSGGAIAQMYALIVVAGLLGWGLNVLFQALERRTLHWHPSHRQVAR